MSVKLSLFILLLTFALNTSAIEARLFSIEDNLYLVLINNSPKGVDVAKNLILGDCEDFTNICLNVFDDKNRKKEILPRPMKFDILFEERVILNQTEIYGLNIGRDEIVSRFGLTEGDYRVEFVYQDSKHNITSKSNSIIFSIKEVKATTNGYSVRQ